MSAARCAQKEDDRHDPRFVCLDVVQVVTLVEHMWQLLLTSDRLHDLAVRACRAGQLERRTVVSVVQFPS